MALPARARGAMVAAERRMVDVKCMLIGESMFKMRS
jgi:hypothetical protein